LRDDAPDSNGVLVSVMTYNVGNGLAHPSRLAHLLRLGAADLVGLQELALPQAEVLAADLADVYPVLVAHPPPPRLSGARIAFDPMAVCQIDTLANLGSSTRPACC